MNNYFMQKKWIIYMYTFPNEKRYIGKTHRSLADRQGSKNWIGYRNCTVLWRAIQKYKIQNIRQDILVEDYMEDEYASRLEMMFIALFKTNCNRYKDPSYGYNETDGGEGSAGYKHTEENKIKMKKPRYQNRGENHHSSKPVYCLELDRVFVNAREAEAITEVSFGSISNNCVGKSKSTHGGNTEFNILHWEFRLDAIKNNCPKDTIKVKNVRQVYCVELNKFFDSATSAEEQGYGKASSIRHSCKIMKNKNMIFVRNNCLHWLYASDATNENIEYILDLLHKCENKQQSLKQKQEKTYKRGVYCIELKKYFDNAKEAELHGYGNARRIEETCLGRQNLTYLPNGKVVHWVFSKDVDEKDLDQIIINNLPKNWKRIYCIEQDRYYCNEREAENENGLPHGYISRVLNNMLKNYNNEILHFRYADEKLQGETKNE